ncbi:Condensin-2 complex subunit G2 [Bienertia sinuspersici]
MEKRLRSSLQNSADSFLESSIKFSPKSVRTSLKTLIHTIKPSSELSTSLPLSLHTFICRSIAYFKDPSNPRTPPSPPSKKPRRSSRNSTVQEEDAPSQTTHIHNLQIYAHIALICTKHPKKAFLPDDLFPAIKELHDNLILFESDNTLLSEISSLCELWWKEEFAGRELLISQFLPFLVSRSLTLRKKVDVHRVCVLREAFMLFDFEDESIEDLKLLLIRCVIAPLYLKTEDGRRFIAFLFGLSLQLLKEVLAMIKSQIPFGRKSMLEAYGEILFKGWKSLDGDLRKEIEDGFLQSLMEGATFAGSSSFAASIRRVLGGFTNQRTTDGVEKVLFRLAEPVIFRSLQVANSNVRQNALHLLLDMFPLEDPDSSKEAKDTLLEKQVFLLEKLLKDDCPDVRVVAVEGCCRILRLFWEIIPSSTITRIAAIIFDDMSHDISNEVRLSTLNGIIYMIGNPQTHELLKVLLPRLHHMIMDSLLSIRIAMVDLLLLIMDVRGFQFNKVVNLDVLLTTLANDQPAVAQKIVRLLLPSYFPTKLDVAEACTRVLTLIKRSPLAGARFCEFLASEGASSKSLMELVRALTNLVHSSDKLDADHIKGIFLALCHLCKDLVSESCHREPLKKLYSGEKLKGLLVTSMLGNAQSSLFDIVSTVSPVGANALFEECLGIVSNCRGLSEDGEKQAEVRSAHNLILSCKWFDSVFEALSRILQDTAIRKAGSPKNQEKENRKNEKGPVAFRNSYQISVGIAWQMKDLLASETSRKAMLKSKHLKVVIAALKVISEISIEHSTCCSFMEASLVDAYMVLSLRMTLQRTSVKDVDDHSDRENHAPKSEFEEANKVLNAGGLAKVGSISSGCKLCHNMAVQFRRQKQVNSHVDSPYDDDDDEDVLTGHCTCPSFFLNKFIELLEFVGSPFSYRRRMLNSVKICTAVLKFTVDVAALNLHVHNIQKILNFTSAYMQNMISISKRSFHDEVKFQEDQLRELHLCLKSSFTYAAKLLNIILSNTSEDSPAPLEVYEVGNLLLDLIASIELYCGSNYAARLVTLAKQWLPDVVLGLGSRCLLKHSMEENVSAHIDNDGEMHIHPWLSILASIELFEMKCSSSDDEEDDKTTANNKFPAFSKLIGMMVQLLRKNYQILDIVGLIFFIGCTTGLQRKDFGLVLGLVRFVSLKLLLRHDDTELQELHMIMTYLQKLYPQVENCIEEEENSDGLQELLGIKELLDPLWLYSCEI